MSKLDKKISPALEYDLLDPGSRLQDIHILHRGGVQIHTFLQVIWPSNE